MMKEKFRKVFRNRIFIFVLGVLVSGAMGVYAATYFPSNDVTYDNSSSGLKSTDVQGAIDELYNTCKKTSTGGDGILDKEPIVTSGDGLYEDEYEEGRYFYKGADPNNYVTFNNEQAGWRIMSIEPDKTLKIVTTNTIGYQYWDSSYSNNWSRPASINAYLNSTYYNSLTDIAKGQIVSNNFNIGTVTSGNNDLKTQMNNESSVKWYGKIALPTVSEYLRTNSNINKCKTLNLASKNVSTCKNTNWMYEGGGWWLLSGVTGRSDMVFYVSGSSNYYVYSEQTYNGNAPNGAAYNTHPVLNLSSTVNIIGGNGSQNNPYVIE